MSDTYIEKNLLYLVALSILLHVAAFIIIAQFPQGQKALPEAPYMVDLQDMPELREKPPTQEKKVKRFSEERRRVWRETAPPGEFEAKRPTAAPRAGTAPIPLQPPAEEKHPVAQIPAERGQIPAKERQVSDFFKPEEQAHPRLEKLFPSAEKLARLEEGYRKRYGPEVEEGDTTFMNTDDLQFGSFLRRFEAAVYGVWRYPAEAAQMGIEGVTPVRITFNRKGEIEKVQILESSGSKLLDEEVRRTLKMVGPIGGFPRGYDKEDFNLIAFFHYGIVRGKVRGTLH